MKRTDMMHGMYRIIAARQGERAQAIAYAGTRRVEACSGDDVAEAIEKIVALLDQRIAGHQAQRTEACPSPQEFADALDRVSEKLSPAQRLLLRVHSRFPERAMERSELARLAASTEEQVMRDYARLGRQLGMLMDIRLERGTDAALALIVAEEPAAHGVAWRFRPEFSQALAVSGLIGHTVRDQAA